jgi:Zn-dependent protease/predicted transcriptional regulator
MKIARIYGIDIKLRFSTLFIVGLVGFYAANFYFSLVQNASLFNLFLVGIVSGLIILFSILAHELMHSIVAQKYGLKVTEIELYLFGGISKIEEEPRTPKSEMIIAVVGPLTSLIIGGLFLLIAFLFPNGLPALVFVPLFYTGISNIGLGFFNLLPAFPVDGGRILRAFLWYRRRDIISATKNASRIGSFFAYGLIGYGFIQILLFGFLNGFWFIIIGYFLNTQTKQSYLQIINEVTLTKISAKDMISMPILEIPFDTTISEALSNYFIVYKKAYFPVSKGGRIVGIIHIDDIRSIPPYQRTEFIVGYTMRSVSKFPKVDEKETGKEAMKKLVNMSTKPHLIAVQESGEDYVLGFIGEDDLVTSLKYCQLNPDKC